MLAKDIHKHGGCDTKTFNADKVLGFTALRFHVNECMLFPFSRFASAVRMKAFQAISLDLLYISKPEQKMQNTIILTTDGSKESEQ